MEGSNKRMKAKFGIMFASIFAFFLAIPMVFKSSAIYQKANAADAVAYMAWDEDSKTVKNVEGGCTEYTSVTSSSYTWSEGWYVLDSDVTIDSRISVDGTVNLILKDGFELKANKGIELVDENSNFNIYAQSEGESAGKLTATGDVDELYFAGIGSKQAGTCGDITIHGGNITATGSKQMAPGIGSSYQGHCGDIIINGGVIVATGARNGAGIGSGYDGATCGDITINGGKVTATGGRNGAGIGSSYFRNTSCGNITINGGDITATGGEYAAGIGSGESQTSCGSVTISNLVTSLTVTKGEDAQDSIGRGENSSCGTVTVCGAVGYVSESPYTATKITYNNVEEDEIKDDSIPRIYKTGAAVTLPSNVEREGCTFLGWFDNSKFSGTAMTEISATATGDMNLYAKWEWPPIVDASTLTKDWTIHDTQTLIGTLNGNYKIFIEDGATVTLQNVTINSNKSYRKPGIELLGDGNIILSGTSTIKGQPGIYVPENKTLTIGGQGTLNAVGLDDYSVSGAGIGGATNLACGNIVINSGTINATGANEASGIGGFQKKACGDITINGGTITATGGKYASGIGAAEDPGASCGDITINGGTVTARGGQYGTGIGASRNGSICGNITISGGVVDARGGDENPGIGVGPGYWNHVSRCGDITITGGTVDARAGYLEEEDDYAAGIGNSGKYDSHCGNITITNTVDSVCAIGTPYSIGGYDNCGTVTVGDKVGRVAKSPYCYLNHDPVPYLTWNEEEKGLVQAEEDCESFKLLTSSMTTLDFDWYVVEGKLTFEDRITISGNVSFILTDGSEIEAKKGISAENATFNIYAQSEGNNAGKITAKVGQTQTGITGGAINIFGGVITVEGGDCSDPAEGDGGSGLKGSVAIYGGKITATGGRYGGGITFNGDYHDIVIKGGTVIAKSKYYGIGIGGDGGTITISGGNVDATGESKPGIGGLNVYILIDGGEVTARGGSHDPGIGAEYTSNANVTVVIEKTVTKLTSYRGKLGQYSIGCYNDYESGVSVTIGGKDYGKGTTKDVFIFPSYHTVTFETDGGEIDSSEIFDEFREDLSTPLPTTVTKEHFTFEGWYEDEDFTNDPVTEIPEDTAENKIYYAKWERITHDITFNLNEGQWDGEHDSKYGEGLGLTLPTNVVKEGYSFLGWFDNEELNGDPITAIDTEATTDKEYWAKWIEVEVYNAEASINDLPPVDDITIDDKDDIFAAKAEYDALSPELKEKVSQDVVNKLLEAVDKINTVIADGVADDINALPSVDEIKYEDKQTVLDVKAEYDALTDDQKAKVDPEVVKKLEDACDRIASFENSEGTIEDIDALPAVNQITLDDKDDVLNAKAEYDALSPEAKKDISEERLNKLLEAFDKVNTLIAEDATNDINELPEVGHITIDDKDEVEAVIAKYDALTDEQKEKLSPETISKIEAVRKDIADVIVANETTTLIDALPNVSDVSLDDEDTINAVIEAYESLTDDQKAKIDPEVIEKLEAVSKEIKDIVAAKETTDVINAIPDVDSITIDDREEIYDAVAKYDALTDDQKAKVDSEIVEKLNAAKAKIDAIILDNVIDGAGNLPNPQDVTLNDKAEIEEVLAQYESLTPEQKESLDPEVIAKIEAVKDSLDTLVADDATNDIDALPEISNITLDDKDEIEAAYEKYESLSDDQLEKLSPETIAKIEEAKKEIDDIVAAKEVTDDIDALPEVDNITLNDRDAIEEVLEAYNSLTEDQLEKLSPETIEKIEAAKDALDTVIAEDATNDINDLPSVEDISLDDKQEIEDVIAKYESLSEEQKDKLPEEVVEKYEQVIEEYKTIENANETIVDLPDASDITSDDFDSVSEAREIYDSLTPEQQEKLPAETVAKLEEAEHAVDVIVVDAAEDLVNGLGDITFDDDSKTKIEDARATYESLTDEQKEMFPEETLELLENYEEAFDTMGKIDAIGEIENSDASKEAIEEAKTAYDALTDEQKDLLDEDYVKTLLDSVAVQEVIDEVNQIGAIKFTDESKESIEEAREFYESLTDDQKEMFPADTLKSIENSEAVYDVLEKIYSIGEINYDTASEESIKEARAAYDALTDEQKAMVDVEAVTKLKNSEKSYQSKRNSGNAVSISLLIVSSLALAGGVVLLYFLLKGFKKGKGTKMNSFGLGFATFVVLASHYADPQFIALYIIAGLAVAVWIAVLVVFLMKKQTKKAADKAVNTEKAVEETSSLETEVSEEVKPVIQETVNQVSSNDDSEEEDEVLTVKDEKGNIFQIRFIKSFMAKLIQSPEETKKYYEELKNEVLSYKKTTSRISWNYDSINSGRSQVLKFAIRGKTLCVYYPLNADEYNDSKYKVEKVESKKYSDVPCLYRIKNDRRLSYAKELIAVVMEKLGLEKGEEQHEIYANLPYEANEPLLARGLIKELKVQVNKPVEEVLETKVNSDGDEIVTTKDSKGNIFEIRYIKSFTAKLSQSEDLLKDYYNELKNYALSYDKANSRVSWHFDSINVGRNQVIKFVIRGKTLCLYYALNADDYADSKYKVEKVESKKYEDVPCLYRIKNERRFGYAKDLIDAVMAKLGVEKGKESNEDFRIPYEETKVLLKKGLIKELKTKVNNPVEPVKPVEVVQGAISVNEADKKMTDEVAESNIEKDNSSKKHEGKKTVINIDTIGDNFNDGDVVDLEALWKKKLVPTNVGFVKVLARGTLNKKLNVYLQDYSIQAVKMILLEGGTVKKVN